MTGWLILGTWLGVAGAGLPPLTGPQRVQIATAKDYALHIDGPALYPLMVNTLQWPADAAPTGHIPDYQAIIRNPAEYRGMLFLIEGQLGGDPRTLTRRFARPGPWEGKMQQWGVVTNEKTGDVVLVYLTDPPEKVYSQRYVRMSARFYKVWNSVDTQNRETSYLTFIGRSATVLPGKNHYITNITAPHRTGIGSPDISKHQPPDGATSADSAASRAGRGAGAADDGDGRGGSPVSVAMFVLVGFLGVAFWRLRRMLQPRLTPAQLRRMERYEDDDEADATAARRVLSEADDELDDGPPLPKDPTEALAEMQRRRAAKIAAAAEQEATPELRELMASRLNLRAGPPGDNGAGS